MKGSNPEERIEIAAGTSDFVTFRMSGQLYGIPIVLVREINRYLDITPVQNSLPFIRGLANLRGQIVTVLDTAVRLGLSVFAAGEENRCIVLKTDAELLATQAVQNRPELLAHAGPDLVALLVEAIGEVVRCSETDHEQVPANVHEADSRFLESVVKLDDELLLVLDMQAMLAAE